MTDWEWKCLFQKRESNSFYFLPGEDMFYEPCRGLAKKCKCSRCKKRSANLP